MANLNKPAGPDQGAAPTGQRRPWLLPSLVMLGLLSIGLFVWINRLHETDARNFDNCTVLRSLQLRLAMFHLRVEEAIMGDSKADALKSLADLDLAIRLAEALAQGGPGEHGVILKPLRDAGQQASLAEVRSRLADLQEIARQRLQDPKGGGVGSPLDEYFDSVFEDIESKVGNLAAAIEEEQFHTHLGNERLSWGILLIWTLIVGGAAVAIRSREARRKAAETALQEANGALQARTEELRWQEERLTVLVAERTAELTWANLDLQQEIREGQQKEKALRESENKCRLLVEHLPQKIYLKDRDSVYIYCNDNFARDFGAGIEEIVGKRDYDLFPGETAARNIATDKEIMNSGKVYDCEERHARDGQEVIIHKFVLPARDEAGAVIGVLGILWDVTERVRMEAIAQAVATMQDIGSIFAGVMHEMGNPFNSLKLTLRVLQKRLVTYSREEIAACLTRALGEAENMEYIMRTLRSFNMYEVPKSQLVEMRAFMDKFLALLIYDFKKRGIAIESSFAAEAKWGYADPRALQQALLNIVSNAADALDGRNNPRIAIEVAKMGSRIRIGVRDNGCGMSEEQQQRLFTPLFTTKVCGTGLGLINARKLLTAMNGALEVRSKRGEGTSVEIWLQEGRYESATAAANISYH